MTDSQTQPQAKSLHKVLQAYGPEVKEGLVNILIEYNISTNDPLAAVVASLYLANLENLKKLNAMPEAFQQMIQSDVQKFQTLSKALTEELRGIFDQRDYDISKKLGSSLTKAVERSVTAHAKKIDRVTYKQLLIRWALPTLGVASLLAVGGGGFGYARALNTITQKGQARMLSNEEISALHWTTTKDGELARQISQWNAEVIPQCLSRIEELKGRCIIRVVPPDNPDPRVDQ